jgi:23S rRNA pseudouridine1911/1915/1917 synthase
VLYRDDDIVALSKPAGLLSHSPRKLETEVTLLDWFRAEYLLDASTERSGLVHRLDRDTSGVMVFARHQQAYDALKQQFTDRTVVKKYRALVAGNVEDQQAQLVWPIGRNPKQPSLYRIHRNGKTAETTLQRVWSRPVASEVVLFPRTGRTHQLRVHLKAYGHPILGDRLYGNVTDEDQRLYLHAESLTIQLPSNGKQTFQAELPEAFKKRQEQIRGD